MEDNDVFNKNLNKLKELFPSQINDQKINELWDIFDDTENSWSANSSRYSNNKVIKYLLICEAPPFSGDYFYNNYKKQLFTTVWNTFFSNPVCSNSNDAYQCLADKGFLLVDTLPYSMDYSMDRKRNEPEYEELIKNSLAWWLKKLDNSFTFAPDLKIAFGFKLNAQIIIKVTKGIIRLSGNKYSIYRNQIAADRNHRWQPSTAKLEKIFGTLTSKGNCHKCQ